MAPKGVIYIQGHCRAMSACRHESLDFVGEQKTDEGVNSYYRCRACLSLLVVLPTRKVVGIPGVLPVQPQGGGEGTT